MPAWDDTAQVALETFDPKTRWITLDVATAPIHRVVLMQLGKTAPSKQGDRL